MPIQNAQLWYRLLLSLLGVFLLSISGALLYWAFYLDYETWTVALLGYLGKEDWAEYFKTAVFPEQRFWLLRVLAPSFLLASTIGIVLLFIKEADLLAYIQRLKAYSVSLFKQEYKVYQAQPASVRWLFKGIFFLFLFKMFYYTQYFELQYDEYWTYHHFIDKGIVTSALSPNNNHVLYTLFAALFQYLPLSLKWSLRLPVNIVAVLCFFLYYVLLRRNFRPTIALGGLLLYLCSPPINAYSFYARSYIFVVFFTLTAMFAFLKFYKEESAYRGLLFSYVLGMYSNPIFIYPAFIFSTLLLVKLLSDRQSRNWISFKRFFIGHFFAIFAVLLLYLPLFLTNGWEFLLRANTQQTVFTIETFWSYVNKLVDWWWIGKHRDVLAWPFYMIYLVLLLLGFKTYRKRSGLLLVSLAFSLFPFCLVALQQQTIPFRVWTFCALFFPIPILIFSEVYLRPKYLGPTFISILALLLVYRAHRHHFIRWSDKADREVVLLGDFLLKKQAREVYFFSHYDKPGIKALFDYHDQKLNCYMGDSSSKDFAVFTAQTYDYVLWDKEDRVNTIDEKKVLNLTYHKVFETARIDVYKKGE